MQYLFISIQKKHFILNNKKINPTDNMKYSNG
jgi:hypothetical protein